MISPLPRRVRALTAAVAAAVALSGCSSTTDGAPSSAPDSSALTTTSAPAPSGSETSSTPDAATPDDGSNPAPQGDSTASDTASAAAPTTPGAQEASSSSAAAGQHDHGATDCSVAHCVALTFDDGPKPSTDTRLLEVLAAHGAKATFFMIGENVDAYPETARRIAQAGHEVGNHSTTHPTLTHLSAAGVKAELKEASASIRKATGQTPALMRPPYGASDASVKQAIARAGMTQVLWNLDTLDWKTRNAAKTLAAVKAEAHPGAVILMHDIHATTIDAVDPMITWLQSEGYTLVTLSDLLDG